VFILALIALGIMGVFATVLGTAHFFFPKLLDFAQAIPRQGVELNPFRLGPIRYDTLRSDVLGIAYVMNHAASYTIASIGIADLLAYRWLGSEGGRWLLFWIAGFWFLRAGSQLYMGRRRGDWWILAGFAWLGIVHLGIGILNIGA
jgi:hypothetical protein